MPHTVNQSTTGSQISYGVWFLVTSLFIVAICSSMASFLQASPWLFIFIIVAIYFSRPPKYFLSPRNIITGFYFLWYGFGVLIGGERYGSMTFTTIPEVYAYIMLTFGFFCWYAGATFGEEQPYSAPQYRISPPLLSSGGMFMLLYIVALALAFIYVQSSGGLLMWLTDPGRAFLQREGSGVFVILFYTFFHMTAMLASYKAAIEKKYGFLILSIITTLILIPLLGGKGRIFFHLILLSSCFIYNKKTSLKLVIGFFLQLAFAFAFVTLSRTASGNSSFLAVVASNYFDTYQALVMLLRDFAPGDKLTILMPFNKFSSMIGFQEGMYYDMSHWLTSIYFPTVAKLRATVQWPIEADLYLSFGFFPGLPLVLGWGYLSGRIFILAITTKQCGFIFLAINLAMIIVSHARGGVLNWTDFWLVPSLILSYIILRPYTLASSQHIIEKR